MQPIETEYKGYRFRSRLEARWAVFMEALGMDWDYEPQGFRLGEGVNYLPDFWIPTYNCWIEVKGPKVMPEDQRKAHLLAVESGSPVILAQGQFELSVSDHGWLNLSPVCHVYYGTPTQAFRHLFPYHEDVSNSRVYTNDHCGYGSYIQCVLSVAQHLRQKGYNVTYEHSPASLEEIVRLDKKYYRDEYGEDHPNWEYGWMSPPSGGTVNEISVRGADSKVVIKDHIVWAGDLPQYLKDAYLSAQQARFEYGEQPAA